MSQQRRSSEIRKREILSAARKLIIRRGSEHLTVRAMAHEVGLTEAAIYRHFRSKREVLLFLVDDILDTLIAEVERVSGEEGSLLERLARIQEDHLSEIEQRRGMAFLVIAETLSFGDRRLNREVHDKLAVYLERLSALVAQGCARGEIREDVDPQALARLLFGMIQGLVTLWALADYRFDLSAEYRPLWDLCRRSLEPRR
ncbi:MAG: TetR/AcrR family transcriptional regulator [Desulfobacterales bacterium]